MFSAFLYLFCTQISKIKLDKYKNKKLNEFSLKGQELIIFEIYHLYDFLFRKNLATLKLNVDSASGSKRKEKNLLIGRKVHLITLMTSSTNSSSATSTPTATAAGGAASGSHGSAALSTVGFRWIELLEKEFDKSFLALDQALRNFAEDYEVIK